MDIGDLIMWALLMAGAYAITRNTWHLVKPRLLWLWRSSTLPPAAPVEITSSRADDAPSEASRPRTDETADGRTNTISSELRPATLDICKSLRAHGYTRDEARAFLRDLGWTLGNNTWSAAQPAPDDEIVTPFAGRKTRAAYYPDTPELEYQPPR